MDRFLEVSEVLLGVLGEYNTATDKFFEIDFEQDDLTFAVDDFEGFLEEREEIKERISLVVSDFDSAVEGLSEEESATVKKLFGGNTASSTVGDSCSPEGKIVSEILRVQGEIVSKDKDISEKFTRKYNEVKVALKDLKGDKRKLDFLNLSAPGEQDSGFQI
ncbi:MAG: hypothetical protein FWF82_04025 [Oscillospiraceae bacterium]|nr:hypothetical protein [Oscillospiraceae bacterium]